MQALIEGVELFRLVEIDQQLPPLDVSDYFKLRDLAFRRRNYAVNES